MIGTRVARRGVAALALGALGLLCASFAAPAHTDVMRRYVDQSAGGVNDGSSWADAFVDLQDALAAATNLSEIWVAAGTYSPGTERTDSFHLPDGVKLYGGFAGGESSLTQRNPATNLTTLSGAIGTSLVTDNSYNVVDAGGVGSETILDGFVVSGGYANGGDDDAQGGGLTMFSGSPVIRNVIFRGNYGIRGGGAGVAAGTPIFDNVTFEDNAADEGGGLWTDEAALEVRNSRFLGNYATNGGGLHTTSANNPLVTGTLFRGNTAESRGGAIEARNGQVRVESSAFLGNSATSGIMYAGGVVTLSNSTFAGSDGFTILVSGNVTVTHVTVADNASAIEVSSGALLIRESILWGNGGELASVGSDVITVERSVLAGGCPSDQTCTDLVPGDPLLGPRRMNGGLTPTYAPGAGSPAIDAGRSAVCSTVGRDQRGVARPIDGDKNGSADCDVGAVEYEPAAPTVAFVSSTSTGTEASGTQSIAVRLSASAVKTVTVKYAVTGGTARRGEDYVLSAGTLTFPAGSTTQNIAFKSVNNRLFEPSETVVLSLSSPVNASLGNPATHTRMIKDNDPKVRCGGKLPTIVGTPRDDTLNGTPRSDVIVGLDGNDTIDGKGGNDIICGGKDNDAIKGGRGLDMLYGEAGNDNLAGEGGTDLLYGGRGRDRLAGGPDPGDFCNGGPERDSLAPRHGCESRTGVP